MTPFPTTPEARTGEPCAVPRRLLLESLGGGLGMLAAAQALAADASAARPGGAAPGPHFVPRARRVIHLFMNGGPFQADLFDPKPALATYAGQRPEGANLRTERKTGGLMPSAASFAQRGESGVPVSDLLPHLAEHVDRICVLRSMHADNPNHGPALFQMNNGTILPTRPSMGSWMLYGLGSANDNLPGYVVLCPGRPVRFAELWTNSFLPAAYQGTYVNHSQLDGDGLIPYLGAPAGSRPAPRSFSSSRAGSATAIVPAQSSSPTPLTSPSSRRPRMGAASASRKVPALVRAPASTLGTARRIVWRTLAAGPRCRRPSR